MPNINDGTQLGTGEIIANEQIDANPKVRREPELPATAYKVPRSKIAVGPYGQDWGDASADMPLQVESSAARRMSEMDSIRVEDQTRASYASARYGERANLGDARGHSFALRGVR